MISVYPFFYYGQEGGKKGVSTFKNFKDFNERGRDLMKKLMGFKWPIFLSVLIFMNTWESLKIFRKGD